MTEKALAKARAEREAAKKAKDDLSVEVIRPRVGSRVGDTGISLHASDFVPVGSAIYTLASPTPYQTDKTMDEAVVPFTKMSKEDRNKRVNEAMVIICTQTNRDHINEVSGKNEMNELYPSWLDVSFYPNSFILFAFFFVANFLL